MPGTSNLIGRVFGRLTVLERTANTSERRAMWLCICECGTTRPFLGKSLIRGATRSCGCLRRASRSREPVAEGMIGKTFGLLTTIERLGKIKGRAAQWLCKCVCGKTLEVQQNNLRSGNTKSCGCTAQRRADVLPAGESFGDLIVRAEAGKDVRGQMQWACDCVCGRVIITSALKILDGHTRSCGCRKYKTELWSDTLIGQRFGFLTVTERALSKYKKPSKGGAAAWLCRCDCGGHITTVTTSLRAGRTRSCGCLLQEAATRRVIDMTGHRYGLLTVLGRAENVGKHPAWKCICDCGSETQVLGTNLKAEAVVSCGCARGQQVSVKSPEARAIAAVRAGRRRAKRDAAEGSFTEENIHNIYGWQRERCAAPCCRERLRHSYHIDHIVPLALGGSNKASNIQLLCRGCNLKKHAKDPILWAQSMGLLI